MFKIGIDTEYHVNEIGIINKVYCICATAENGLHYSHYFGSNQEQEKILENIAKFFEQKPDNCLFICHALELAETRALHYLGVNILAYKFIDTFTLARQCIRSFRYVKHLSDEAFSILTDEERDEIWTIDQQLKQKTALIVMPACANAS